MNGDKLTSSPPFGRHPAIMRLYARERICHTPPWQDRVRGVQSNSRGDPIRAFQIIGEAIGFGWSRIRFLLVKETFVRNGCTHSVPGRCN
jgi:hypothetical protein